MDEVVRVSGAIQVRRSLFNGDFAAYCVRMTLTVVESHLLGRSDRHRDCFPSFPDSSDALSPLPLSSAMMNSPSLSRFAWMSSYIVLS